MLLYDFGAAVLRARGDSRRPFLALVATGGICVFRVLWVLTVCPKFGTLESLYIVWPTSWALANVLIWCGMLGVKILEGKKTHGES